MARIIAFKENIYALEVYIQTLTETTRLPLDPDIFIDHVLEELFFVDRSLSIIQKAAEKIQSNAEREKTLLLIARARGNFEHLISDILSGKTAKSLPLKPALNRLESAKHNQEKEIKRIRELISTHRDEEMVSPEEMAGLLAPPEE
ncbi:hypothetical protein WKV44_06540 [Spirochaetia bacterium 38H-sp]|uniref:Uncharacterized protein n=1 Tax=Rarispira pelagica TaxID=3141764 RepID=A0ABU9UC10_9SPIR